ncbi:MAG TPA: potassium channel protein [Thermotogota bacterium]|nr:potassium channel protein [Thermotogota bacterium]HPJ89954.1 potassium channel protein [Thermotogota bacterium]HPR97162.1 potassium channel protein [Thermotogota bacterium]
MEERTNPGLKIVKQIMLVALMVTGVILFGTFGYMILENYEFQDSLFLTIITVSTVGYSIPETISSSGIILTIVLIGLGVSVVLYGISSITGTVVEGRLNDILKVRRNKKMINQMKDHVIVVGGGRTGRYVMIELIKLEKPFVLIEKDKAAVDRIKDITKTDFPFIIGDATDEEVLVSAGIKHAKSLITSLPKDSLNVYVVLSGRTLNPEVNIISKSSEIKASNKLTYAGANAVVADTQITGIRMARIATKPDQIKFLDVLAFGNQEFRIEEIFVSEHSSLANKTLFELELTKKIRVMIIAIRRGEQTIFSPAGDTTIFPEDSIMVLGSRAGLDAIAQMAQ